ncbi:type II toxin-antitoxin system PrlF family antitoxin [Terriglobus sp.]|uniref:type II toxin-antitoxin system PrlF family antitoxin n=1 Tax=Terriglobus sp. TaxID=1889013 RepID=UPI003B00A22F
MRASEKKAKTPSSTATRYRGKQIKAGNSSGFRFEGALFKSNPEFNGDVVAQIIAPGRLLVTADPKPRRDPDPVMASFLAFLAQDVANAPETIRPLNLDLKARMRALTKDIAVSPDEPLDATVDLG